ncbi:MAG: hypothetical protein KDD50_15360 [Bdellovibrionales bacterium]|nr:hypothetical protein [Bdellovibrionales bacterium]
MKQMMNGDVLIKIDKAVRERETSSGIISVEPGRLRKAVDRGEVLLSSVDHIKPKDRILWRMHHEKYFWEDKDSGEHFMIVNDKNILAKLN